MGEEAYADLRRALRDPEVVHAMLGDYRAGLREDREHDEADRAAGRRITCPLLVVSLLQDDPELDYGADIVDIWRSWALDVQGAAIDCGHHVAEERPGELARLLLDFLEDEQRAIPDPHWSTEPTLPLGTSRFHARASRSPFPSPQPGPPGADGVATAQSGDARTQARVFDRKHLPTAAA